MVMKSLLLSASLGLLFYSPFDFSSMQSYAMQTVIAGTRRVLISFLEKTLQNDTIADSRAPPGIFLLLSFFSFSCFVTLLLSYKLLKCDG